MTQINFMEKKKDVGGAEFQNIARNISVVRTRSSFLIKTSGVSHHSVLFNYKI